MSRNRSDSISNSNSTSDTKISKAEYIATVTECLSDHVKCSKHYVDTVTGKYEVLCKCGCHINKIEKCDPNKSVDINMRLETGNSHSSINDTVTVPRI